jgi:hypothetical protein
VKVGKIPDKPPNQLLLPSYPRLKKFANAQEDSLNTKKALQPGDAWHKHFKSTVLIVSEKLQNFIR